MKELEYPFDAAYIIKKRKSLKKALLADGTSRIRKKIAVFGGSTTSDIVKTLELFLLDAGIEPEFYESEYAQYFQDAMFPDETLLSFKPDIVFIHTTNRNVTDWPEMTDTTEQIDEKLHTEINRFTAMWKSIAEKFHCPIIQNNFEMPLYRLLGSRDAWDIHGRTNFLTRLNEAFYAYARENESFYIHDLNFVSADYGLKEWSNPLFWNMYKYAMCLDAIPSLMRVNGRQPMNGPMSERWAPPPFSLGAYPVSFPKRNGVRIPRSRPGRTAPGEAGRTMAPLDAPHFP